jgi:hypothetical protein
MPTSIAALLVTPSVDQFPVREKRPPMVISWFDDGEVELSQPAARTDSARAEVAAARSACERSDRGASGVFMIALGDGIVTVLDTKIHAHEVFGA